VTTSTNTTNNREAGLILDCWNIGGNDSTGTNFYRARTTADVVQDFATTSAVSNDGGFSNTGVSQEVLDAYMKGAE
jgi:hypothetical protein